MKEYLKSIVREKEELTEREKRILSDTGNLPVLNKVYTKLSPLAEMIVKIIYLAGGMFLSDIKKLFCFSADTQKVERAIKDLREQGYLIVENTAYGNLYGLTKEGMEQIRNHPDYIEEGRESPVSEMKIKVESSLLKRKLLSGMVAEYIFQYQLKQLWNQFFTTDKLTRNVFLMKQYIKNISYRDYLQMEEADRTSRLIEIGIDRTEAEVMSKTDRYSLKGAEKYAEAFFETLGFEEIKAGKEYREYIAYIRKNCLSEANYNTFYLLKELPTGERKSEYYELELLLDWKSNMHKFGMEKVWESLLIDNPSSLLLHNEKALEQCCQHIKWLSDVKRSLISTNAYKKKEEGEALKEILEKIEALECVLERYREKKEELETDFSFAVLSNCEEGEVDYDVKILTFKRLEQNGIFVEVPEKKTVRFYVLQQQDDYFDFFSLHKKLAMLFQFCRRLFPLYQIEIRVLVYSEEQKGFIEGKSSLLAKKLLAGRETALLGNMLSDVMKVVIIRSDMKERYVFFKEMYEYLKNGGGQEEEWN